MNSELQGQQLVLSVQVVGRVTSTRCESEADQTEPDQTEPDDLQHRVLSDATRTAAESMTETQRGAPGQ